MGSRERAVIYMRQSTFREESISLELQETACRQYARERGYAVVTVEADPGVSGRTFDRPAVQRVMGMVESGAVDVVLLWKWSRLSRSRRDWAVAADRVERVGGRVESATEAIDTSTSTGRLARGVMVEFAAFESERIGDVWREAHARRLAAGKPINGKARFGYQYDREEKLHVPDPVEGPVLAEAYERYLAGESFYALIEFFQRSGTAPAAGYGVQRGQWSSRTIQRVMDSGFAAGIIRAGGREYPGVHEKLISEETFARYRARRAAQRQQPRTERSQYILSGLTRCGRCGYSMQVTTHRETGPRLRCREATEHRAHPGGYIQLHYVESAVREWVAEVAAEVTAGTLDASEQRRVNPRPRLEAEQEKTREALTQLAMRLAEGIITPEVYQAAAGTYEKRLQALAGELAAYETEIAAGPPARDVIVDLDADWDLLPVPARREMLTNLIKHVEVHTGRGADRRVIVHGNIGGTRAFTT